MALADVFLIWIVVNAATAATIESLAGGVSRFAFAPGARPFTNDRSAFFRCMTFPFVAPRIAFMISNRSVAILQRDTTECRGALTHCACVVGVE